MKMSNMPLAPTIDFTYALHADGVLGCCGRTDRSRLPTWDGRQRYYLGRHSLKVRRRRQQAVSTPYDQHDILVSMSDIVLRSVVSPRGEVDRVILWSNPERRNEALIQSWDGILTRQSHTRTHVQYTIVLL